MTGVPCYRKWPTGIFLYAVFLKGRFNSCADNKHGLGIIQKTLSKGYFGTSSFAVNLYKKKGWPSFWLMRCTAKELFTAFAYGYSSKTTSKGLVNLLTFSVGFLPQRDSDDATQAPLQTHVLGVKNLPEQCSIFSSHTRHTFRLCSYVATTVTCWQETTQNTQHDDSSQQRLLQRPTWLTEINISKRQRLDVIFRSKRDTSPALSEQ